MAARSSRSHCPEAGPAPRRAPASLLAPVLALGLWLGAGAAQGAGWSTYAVDDSASRIEGPAPALRWRSPLVTRNGGGLLLDAQTQVRIVLNLAPWVGKTARIYMVMPVTALPSLAVEWVGSGTLQNGRLSGGQRQLVYQGVVAGPRLEDTLRVHASVDARDAAPLAPVNFRFEIEVPAP